MFAKPEFPIYRRGVALRGCAMAGGLLSLLKCCLPWGGSSTRTTLLASFSSVSSYLHRKEEAVWYIWKEGRSVEGCCSLWKNCLVAKLRKVVLTSCGSILAMTLHGCVILRPTFGNLEATSYKPHLLVSDLLVFFCFTL